MKSPQKGILRKPREEKSSRKFQWSENDPIGMINNALKMIKKRNITYMPDSTESIVLQLIGLQLEIDYSFSVFR